MTRIIVRTANIISSSVFFIISLSLFVSLYALLVITPMALYLIFSIIIDLVYSFLGISKHAVQQFPGAFKMDFYTMLTSSIFYGAIIASVISVINIFRIINVAFREKTFGKEIILPKIFGLADEVARDVGTTPFRKVLISKEFLAGTVYTFRGKWLILHPNLLKVLTRSEFKTVLAHEYAHYHDSAMLFSRVQYQLLMVCRGFEQAILSILNKIENYADKRGEMRGFDGIKTISGFTGFMLWVNLLFQKLFFKYLVFIRWLTGIEDFEFYCDSVAIELYGSETFIDSVVKISLVAGDNKHRPLADFLTDFEQLRTSVLENKPVDLHGTNNEFMVEPGKRIARALALGVSSASDREMLLTFGEMQEI